MSIEDDLKNAQHERDDLQERLDAYGEVLETIRDCNVTLHTLIDAQALIRAMQSQAAGVL